MVRRCIWEATLGSSSGEQGLWEREGGKAVGSARGCDDCGNPGLSATECTLELPLWRGGGRAIYPQTPILHWLRFAPLGTSSSPPGCPERAERLPKEPRGEVQGALCMGVHTAAVVSSRRAVWYSKSHCFCFSDTSVPITTTLFIDCFFVYQSLG